MSIKLVVKYLLAAILLGNLLFAPLLAQSALTETELLDLTFMREEEKLARDVYSHLHTVWGSQVFASIAMSEQRHMDAVLNLLNIYGVADPAAGNAAGVFTNLELQQLYDSLVVQGEISETSAMQVGITVEETDIADLQSAIDATSQFDVKKVYNNLLKGSLNHLAAFTNSYEALGGDIESGSQNGNPLLPGTSIYEPISETLYIPALDLITGSGATLVYDVLLRLVEALPQALEVISVTETSKLSNADHASFDAATGTLNIPDVSFGTLTLPDENSHYSLTLQLVNDTGAATIFVVTELKEK